MFGTAIIGAISRTALRYHNTSRLTLDDGFLFVACVALVAATVILYKFIPGAYLFEVFAFHPPSVLPPGFDFDKTVLYNVKLLDAYNMLSWVVIYSVKFCFLSFFRSLIDRLQKMIVYWRVVVGITAVFFGLSLCETFIACPRIKPSSCKLSLRPQLKDDLPTTHRYVLAGSWRYQNLGDRRDYQVS